MDKYNEYGELVTDDEDGTETVEELTEVPQSNELFRQVQSKINPHESMGLELPSEPQQVPDDKALAQLLKQREAKSTAANTGTPSQPNELKSIVESRLAPAMRTSPDTVRLDEREASNKLKQDVRTPSQAMSNELRSRQELEDIQMALLNRELFGGEVDGKPYSSFQQQFKEAMEKAGRGAAEIGKDTQDKYAKDTKDAAWASAIDKGIGALGKIASGVVGLNPEIAKSGSRVLPVAEHYKYEPQVDQKELMNTAKQASSLGMQRAKGLTENAKMREAARQKEAARINSVLDKMMSRSGEELGVTGMNVTTKEGENKATNKLGLNTNIVARLATDAQKDAMAQVSDPNAALIDKTNREMAERSANLQMTGSLFDPPAIQARFDNAGGTSKKLAVLSDLGRVLQTNGMTNNPEMWQEAILADAKILPQTLDQKGMIGGKQIKQAIANYFKLISSQPNAYDTKAYPKWQQQVQAYGFNPPGAGGTVVSIPRGEPKAAPGVLPQRKPAASPQRKPVGTFRSTSGGSDPYGVLSRK